jgi:hypothetical protein
MSRETRHEVAIFVAIMGLSIITFGHPAKWQAIVAITSILVAYGFHASARSRRK